MQVSITELERYGYKLSVNTSPRSIKKGKWKEGRKSYLIYISWMSLGCKNVPLYMHAVHINEYCVGKRFTHHSMA